jgi:hypothetical protein
MMPVHCSPLVIICYRLLIIIFKTEGKDILLYHRNRFENMIQNHFLITFFIEIKNGGKLQVLLC